MSDDNKQKGNWRLLLVGVVLGSVITVGAFWIYPSIFNQEAENPSAKRVKMDEKPNWGWTGFSGKTLWDWLELGALGAVPFMIFILGRQFRKKDFGELCPKLLWAGKLSSS